MKMTVQLISWPWCQCTLALSGICSVSTRDSESQSPSFSSIADVIAEVFTLKGKREE